jgi:glutamate-1-semialdehyde 2,1-aminomutase/spore coat polysaccharide biosynthesis protein SpsF
MNLKKLNLRKNNSYLDRNNSVLASASTFSKLIILGTKTTPFCIVRGDGPYTWDVDNNKYIDYVIGLGPITLGHNHPKVNHAIAEQLENGTSFSLPSPLEIEVAEMLVDHIPSAEKVKFGKNGNDATSAAVRVSRYHTNKNHILFCGYHGWQDWYAGQTSMNGGVPDCVKEMSHRFIFNDLDSLTSLIEKYKDNVACIIMEAITAKEQPKKGFLEEVRRIATENNIILIFDEVVTGFRFHKAGAQALYGVTPDLSCFSKAMGNGMPISALVGKEKIMADFKEIWYSITNAGEILSLAAAKAVIEFHDEVDVPKRLMESGSQLRQGLQKLIDEHDLSEDIKLLGHDCRFGVQFSEENDLVRWAELSASNGILTNGWFMLSYAHTADVIDETLEKYDEIMTSMKKITIGRK